ncbi:TolB family protein [Maritalea myrionectae]|uniref:TolB family protein n=1 Tax=Maritalea myrionectae TaxID=454601 RepID=UPI0003F78F5B|nr:PD40 domain-containing protein [Maritalea myrionectae]
MGDSAIYPLLIEGGTPVRVTEKTPSYWHGWSPDGAWIWFNGEKDGSVQLWRMRPDGRDLQQMTDEDSVNWFPHPAPDGRHILYHAYPAGTKGHPFGKDVELRLMPAEGGKSRTLTTLYGGQGTINVPCWAPDSARFAYVSYSA